MTVLEKPKFMSYDSLQNKVQLVVDTGTGFVFNAL